MKRFMRLLLVPGLLLVGAGTLTVADTSEGATISGTLVRMEGQTVVVRTAEGDERTYRLATGYQVPADVQPGMAIELMTSESSGGTVVTMIHSDPATSSVQSSRESRLTNTETSTTQYGSTTTGTSDQYASSQYADDDLPETASPIWIYGITGLIALGGGLLLRRRNARSVTRTKAQIRS
jgi:MYXO-CTERM domain-containing protein